MRFDCESYLRNIHGSQESYKIQKEWDNRAPLLSLSGRDQAWGANMLKQLGIPPKAWFVCIHARESGFSEVDDEIQAYRNSSITNLIPSIQEIVRRGGWVVRLGDKTSSKLPTMTQTIDYAHHPLKCDRLDLVLCAKAKFILGNTSGISLLGTIFGTPCALANLIPISTLWFTAKDISIFKLLWLKEDGRYLTFYEAMATESSTWQFSSLYEKHGILPIENSAEDICMLTVEMLDMLEEKRRISTELSLNNGAIKSAFKSHHYAYGSAATIAAFFLEKYKDILFQYDVK
jgi:putative glycosyltransferase (TIGR04372 family)